MTASAQPKPATSISVDWRSDVAVLLCLALALVAGWFFKNSVQGQTQLIEDPLTGLRLQVPVTWQADQDVPNVILAASNNQSASTFKTKLTVITRQVDTASALAPDQIVERLVQQHEEELLGYHLLAIEPALGRSADQAQLISYAYVVKPESVDRPFQASLPVVVQAADYVFFTADRYYVLTLAADSLEYDGQAADFARILASLSLP